MQNCGSRVTPLYKHTFNSLHSSMVLIGVNSGYNPFQHVDYQIQWVLSVWLGHKSLPSKENMLQDEDKRYQERLQQGLTPHLAGHFFGSSHGEMIDQMAHLAGSKPQEPVLKILYDDVQCERNKNLMQYKSINYTILDKNTWALQS